MNRIVSGERTRPRLAWVGGFFDSDDFDRCSQLFPTVWHADHFAALQEQVDPREIDVLVVGSDIAINKEKKTEYWWSFVDNAHVICFSEHYVQLPGPFKGTLVANNALATGETYELVAMPLPIHNRRQLDLSSVDSVRGWGQYRLKRVQGELTDEQFAEFQQTYINDSAVIVDHHDQVPLAVMYLRENNLGVACLPGSHFSLYEWIEIISLEWAKHDKERFTIFGDWTKLPDWMVPEEVSLAERIHSLEEQKQQFINQIDREVSELSQQLSKTALNVNQGRRRLLTAQDSELVEEVGAILNEIGFEVEFMDDTFQALKREDLRLRHPQNTEWEALVEVRGYSKSAGKTSDLQRMGRFASLYQQEKGRLPDKLIYVVNGQIEIQNPSQRQEPLASAAEDVEVFAEDSGLVISTTDLFQVVKFDHDKRSSTLEEIKEATGRWKPLLNKA